MRQTSDGGYIISGFIWPTKLFQKACCYLVKIDSEGNLEWDKHIYNGNSHCIFRTIQQTSDGGYILAGETHGISLLSLMFSVGGDIWLLKTDSDGNIEWEKTFGNKILEDGAFDVEITDDGGYLVAGFTKGFGAGITFTPGSPPISKAWVVKTDADGNIQWEEEISQGICYHCETTIGGGYIITGGEKPYADGDAFLIKID
jgi:hypothetical protein